MKNVDYSKVSPDVLAKIQEWEKENPSAKQIDRLDDIALLLQELINMGDEERKANNKAIEQIGSLLTDAREQLVSLNDKESPEAPDSATPVVDKLDKLEKMFEKINFSPKIEVKAPDVTVPEPKVTVQVDAPDVSGIEKLLKTEVPKAFEEAISKIPEPKEYDDSGDVTRHEEMLEKLESIDIATRMKPTFPTTLKVTNPDGTSVGTPTTFDIRNIEEDATYKYFGFEERGGTDWRIMRKTLATNTFLYATGTSDYATNWTGKAGLSYA